MPELFDPIVLGSSENPSPLSLPNRAAMAPLTRNRADNPDCAPTELHATYYSQRAEAGLLISEGSQVSPEAIGYIYTAGSYSEAQVEGWQKVSQAVHAKGGRIFIQLWHVGRMSHPDHLKGEMPLAPSAINPESRSYTPEGFKPTPTPRAMTQEDIHRTQGDFVRAAKNALRAGCDGAEIHAANGYLFHQFFACCSNQRSDKYGGTIENRARFLFETLDRMKAEGAPLERIGVRLNPSCHELFGVTVDEHTLPTFDHIVERLNDYPLAYLHLCEPFSDVSEVPHAETQIARRYRPKYKGTLMINSAFDFQKAQAVIGRGDADMVAFGKAYLANPDLLARFRAGAPLNEPNTRTFYSQGATGYTDYPFMDSSNSAAGET